MSIVKTYQIMTNLNCNLDCHYCYEKKVGRQGTVADIKTYLTALFKRDHEAGERGQVMIDIIGGEPMLYPDLAYAAMDIANDLAVKYSRSCVHGSISTNGTLFGDGTPATKFVEAFRHQMMVGLSLDGTKEIHDKHRIYKSDQSRGSYDDIVPHIPWLLDTVGRRNVNVKCTMTKETAKSMVESYHNMVQLGFSSISQNMVFEDTYGPDWGMEYFAGLREIMDHWVSDGWYNTIEYTEISSKTQPDYLQAMTRPIKDEQRNSCGTCTHMTCLGFDGNVYGCNRFLTMNQDGKAIATLDRENEVLVPTENGLLQDVEKQWMHKARDPVCGACPIRNECPNCAAVPYEFSDGTFEGLKAYLAERRMCGVTHALSTAKMYAISLMEKYEAQYGQPPDKYHEQGLFMEHAPNGPGCIAKPKTMNRGNTASARSSFAI